ncbi:MAG: L-threonylcarbamoyladenylate synthase [Kiritimatiellia bacterium]|jgi:L-threonylcarbamoyladenylate synthase
MNDILKSAQPLDACAYPEIPAVAACLRNGGVAVLPTETVYGLGAVYNNLSALASVFEIKNRPRFDPLIVHIADLEQINDLAAEIPPAAWALAKKFWPGPLTLVLPKRGSVPDLATAGMPSVAIRMPRHPLALELIKQTGAPLAAPSANRFGGISPTTVAAARAELGDAVKFYLDGGPCAVGLESTVLSLLGPKPTLLRPGGIPLEAITETIGSVHLPASDAEKQRLSPGGLPRHYAPATPLRLWRPPTLPPDAGHAALLTPLPIPDTAAFAQVEVLASDGNLTTAAANLFTAMRRLDASGRPCIYAVLAPEAGLGRAINDRLRRAAG